MKKCLRSRRIKGADDGVLVFLLGFVLGERSICSSVVSTFLQIMTKRTMI